MEMGGLRCGTGESVITNTYAKLYFKFPITSCGLRELSILWNMPSIVLHKDPLEIQIPDILVMLFLYRSSSSRLLSQFLLFPAKRCQNRTSPGQSPRAHPAT